VIDPKQCLFDRHFSATVEANADRMYRKYGFFVPDREYLTDLEGLIGYCHEKIKVRVVSKEEKKKDASICFVILP